MPEELRLELIDIPGVGEATAAEIIEVLSAAPDEELAALHDVDLAGAREELAETREILDSKRAESQRIEFARTRIEHAAAALEGDRNG